MTRLNGTERRTRGGVQGVLALCLVAGTTLAVLGVAVPSATAAPAPLGIYVGNGAATNTVTSYPLSSNGNVAPNATIGSSSSSIDGPDGQVFDANGDLWVANNAASTVVEFTAAQLAATGTPTPNVTISSDGSGPGVLSGPAGLAFDSSGDLWVANDNDSTLVEYTPSQLATSGSPTPAATLLNDNGSLEDVVEIAFDGAGNLWAANYGSSQLSEFTPAQLNCGCGTSTPTPTVAITGSGVDNVSGLTFDAEGNLWTGNCSSTPVVAEYTQAQLAAGGSPTPNVTISSGDLECAYGMQFDHDGTLWVTTGSDLLDGFSASQLATSGSPVPAYVLTGASTGLDGASGLALADTLPAPTAVRATTSGGAVVTVTWQAPPTPMYATSYVVTPIVNGVTQAPIDTNSSAPTFSLSATIGDTYSFKVAATDVFGTGPQGFGTGPQGTSNTVQTWGYWEVASDGGIFGFDAPFLGSQGGKPLNKPVVGMAAAPNGQGYWEVASDGGIFNYGDASFFGSTGSIHLNKPIVGMAATPDGGGYWLVASDGGIFNYGDAGFYGSAGSLHLNAPIVGMAATPDGLGYWLVASDGGIFNYGDAAFYGSAGGKPLNKPVVGIATSADGHGYWEVASDGGIFNYGDTGFFGSQGGKPLNKPIVGIATTSDGQGYWEVASDGGIFNYGDAGFYGSQGGKPLNEPIVGMA